jgi:hypothetical protein
VIPSINCTIPAWEFTVHGNGGNWEHTNVFWVIQGGLIQFQRVYEYQGTWERLEHHAEEHELICKRLAMTRCSRVRKTDLGRKRNYRAMVANRRQEQVLWLRDYLAELTTWSIYRARGRWLLNLEWRAGGRRGRRSLVAQSWHSLVPRSRDCNPRRATVTTTH